MHVHAKGDADVEGVTVRHKPIDGSVQPNCKMSNSKQNLCIVVVCCKITHTYTHTHTCRCV